LESTAQRLNGTSERRVTVGGYPRCAEGVPEFEFRNGAYCTRFARTWRELDEVFKLRYEVFNRELGEGLSLSESSERDEDRFDAGCHHLIVSKAQDGEVVGTYRLMTHELAARGRGFYSSREFELDSLPPTLLREGVELGRACIARAHRGRRVLFHLWRGIGAYLVHNRKRYLFGCASVPSLEPETLAALAGSLREGGHLHPALQVEPSAAYASAPLKIPTARACPPEIPSLMRSYFSLGARVCGGPALDREFGTADYFLVFDAADVDEETYRLYTGS
jgi:putative hemolysin